MKRLLSNKGGEVSYGPKWQHTESISDSEKDDDDLHLPTTTNQDQIPKGKKVEVTVKDGELMYVAALQGDWVAAEVLLDRDPNLAFEYITEEGDRALHVAAAMKRKEFVKKLAGRMNEEELVLLNGHGHTALCYAAISDVRKFAPPGKKILAPSLEIARLIIGNRPNLVTARDEENATPLRKAALRGYGKMLKFLLGYTKDEDLSREEWFDLLLVAIRGEMFGAAIDILGKNGSIATMASEEEGTALHLMAASRMIMRPINIYIPSLRGKEYYPREFRELADKLWVEMEKMEKASLMELIRKPVHIIHEAAKAGQVKIITMLTRAFPKLVRETDCDGYTIFHLAVTNRQRRVFNLFHQVEAMIGLRIMWQDRQGNNILHLAAAVTEARVFHPYQMQREAQWFQAVKEIVPLSCLMIRNGKGQTPGELFSHTHKELLKETKTLMMNRADSLMLIATIVLTVVFAAAFTVPGGYESQTGEPVLAKKKWLKYFVGCEVVSMFSSVLSIMMFQSIMASSFSHREFLLKLQLLQMIGFSFLLLSLVTTYMSFMASIMLYNDNKNRWLLLFGLASLCVYSSAWVALELTEILRDTSGIFSYSEDTLFKL